MTPYPPNLLFVRRGCNHRNFSLKFEPPPFIQFYEGRLLEIFKPFADFWDGNSSEASVDLYNFQIFPPCVHGSGGRQYFAEFLSKAKNIFVDIRFQELACLNFLLDFSSLRKSKLEEQKRNFILNLKWKRSPKNKIIPRYSTKPGQWKFRFGFSLFVKKYFETKTEFPV